MERKQFEAKIQHIHRASLKRRGVPQKVKWQTWRLGPAIKQKIFVVFVAVSGFVAKILGENKRNDASWAGEARVDPPGWQNRAADTRMNIREVR